MRDTSRQQAGLMLWNMAFHPFPTLDGEKKAAIEWAPYQTRRPMWHPETWRASPNW